MTKRKDNVYLNIVFNPDPYNGDGLTPATYNENLTIPVLNDTSKYYCSIIRFDIPLNNIPLVVMPIDATQNDPDLSLIVFGISYLGTNYPVPVVYTPMNNCAAPIPAGSAPYFTNMQLTSPYYYVYSITQMLNMFNTAVTAAVVAAGFLASTAPYYSFDPNTQLFSLTVNSTFYATGATLYLNAYAYNYLASFQYFFVGFNKPGSNEYQMQLSPLPPGAPSGGPYVYVEDYISIDLWFVLRKLLITTNTLPVVQEIVPAQNPSSGQSTGVSSSIPIITDFVPALTFSNEARSIAYYNPTSQYRLVDMNANTPLYKINLNIQWEDKQGNLYPLYLSVLQQASIKLAFLRKELYNPIDMLLEK